MRRCEVSSEKGTQELACKVAGLVISGSTIGLTIGLIGQLGAGKTTFAKYFMKSLGVKEEASSPSYVLSFEYKTPSGIQVEHWDLYRLKCLPDELLEPPAANVIRIVEWADRVEEFLKQQDLLVSIEFVEGDRLKRVFSLSGRVLAEHYTKKKLPNHIN